MRIKYVGPHDAVEVPGGLVFEKGKPVDVPPAVAKGLLKQADNFQSSETKAPAKTEKKEA